MNLSSAWRWCALTRSKRLAMTHLAVRRAKAVSKYARHMPGFLASAYEVRSIKLFENHACRREVQNIVVEIPGCLNLCELINHKGPIDICCSFQNVQLKPDDDNQRRARLSLLPHLDGWTNAGGMTAKPRDLADNGRCRPVVIFPVTAYFFASPPLRKKLSCRPPTHEDLGELK